MRVKPLLSVIIAALVVPFSSAFGQISSAAEHRITEPISINGQSAQGVLVVLDGTVQSYSCPSPARYVTAGRSESGWACFEPDTGMWLLHAQPPSEASIAPAEPSTTTVYVQPNTVYVPSDTYAYPYYPYYGYPFWPGLGFAFGFGNGFHGGHGVHGGFGHGGFHGGGAGFVHGGPGHGGFGHGGGGFRGGGHR